jgi:acyl-CoA synthetase (NDP forming)
MEVGMVGEANQKLLHGILRDLTPLLSPRSIAVIGATPDPHRVGGRPLSFLARFGFPGPIYPVNPKYEEVQGIKCYASVLDIPEQVDMAVVAVPADGVLDVVRECQSVGIPSLTIYTSGFSEMGADGRRLEKQLQALASEKGTLVCGPNCQGVANLNDHMVANFSSTLLRDNISAGSIGFVGQSGLFTGIVAAECHRRGLGLGYLNSTGNESVVDFCDMVAHMSADPRIRVVAGYMEGIRDGEKLRTALEVAKNHNTPVVVLKVGRNEESAKAAASHTGSLAGSYETYQAAFRQWGVIEANDIGELFDFIELFSSSSCLGNGDRVGILTNSGGIGVFCADQLGPLGLRLASLEDKTKIGIASKLPVFGSAENPVDFTLQALTNARAIGSHLSYMVSDENVDAVFLFLGVQMLNLGELVKEIIDANRINEKPIVVSWMLGDESVPPKLWKAGIPCFEDPLRGLKALKALNIVSPTPECRKPSKIAQSAAQILDDLAGEGHRQLGEHQSREILKLLNIPVARGEVVRDSASAQVVAEEIGLPVVMKVESNDIAHKTDVGGVRLNVQSLPEVVSGFDDIMSTVAQGMPEARIEGIGIYEMLPKSVELIAGIKCDPVFGPVILLGTGGVMVEILRDAVVGVTPISNEGAWEMISQLKSLPLLKGERGYDRADLTAVASLLVLLSDFAQMASSLDELDINPVMVHRDGQGVCAADALISLKS